MTHDLHTSECTEPRTPRRMFENIGLEQLVLQADAIWEQQSKRTQSWISRAIKADAFGEQQPKRTHSKSSSLSGHKRRAAAEADAIREQQLKQMQNGEQQLKRIDAIGEQQL